MNIDKKKQEEEKPKRKYISCVNLKIIHNSINQLELYF